MQDHKTIIMEATAVQPAYPEMESFFALLMEAMVDIQKVRTMLFRLKVVVMVERVLIRIIIQLLLLTEQVMVIQVKAEPQELSEKVGTLYTAAAAVVVTVMPEYKVLVVLAAAVLVEMDATKDRMVFRIPAAVAAAVVDFGELIPLVAMVPLVSFLFVLNKWRFNYGSSTSFCNYI